MPARLPAVPRCRDSSDESFLHLTLAARAACLVTGDGDLLALAPEFARPILTPEQFLASLPRG
jgi:predicted nucleic acid-binding protein